MSEPVIKALLLCDYAFRDENRKACLTGIFAKFGLPSVPTKLPDKFVYARIVDAPPAGQVIFTIENAAGVCVWSSGPQIYEGCRDGVLDSMTVVPGFMVFKPEIYRLAVVMNGDRLGELALPVDLVTDGVPK